ncbi:MAG: hypothetical protein NTU79_12880 [Planctomycetota bacterium]|nr:hypothetical protein [Planctomycetota bacterium]
MEFPPTNIDELLSGMLDGALSEREARELTRAMMADPTLQNRLDEISHSRTALLKGRSRGRLGSGFSCKVTELARARAKEMGKDAPEWLRSKPNEPIRSSEFAPDVSRKVERKVELRPWLYACALATAAIFVFVFASVPKTEPDGQIAVNPNGFLGSDKPEQDLIPKEELLAITPPSLEMDIGKSIAPQRYMPKGSAPKVETKTIADFLPPKPKFLDGQDRADPKPPNQNPGEIDPSSPLKKFFFTMVLDITVDKVALENRSLESIFEKYGIVYADDLVINEDQLKALEDSKLVDPTNDAKSELVDSTNVATSEKIGVMFLGSTGEKISLATTDIYNQDKDFPDFSFSISIDKSAGLLVKQLSGIKIDDEASGVVQRLLPPNSKDTARSFSTSPRKAGTKRSEKFPLPSHSSESMEKSYLLLLIRSAK